MRFDFFSRKKRVELSFSKSPSGNEEEDKGTNSQEAIQTDPGKPPKPSRRFKAKKKGTTKNESEDVLLKILEELDEISKASSVVKGVSTS
jgi:hypothetical protein